MTALDAMAILIMIIEGCLIMAALVLLVRGIIWIIDDSIYRTLMKRHTCLCGLVITRDELEHEGVMHSPERCYSVVEYIG